MPSQKFSNDRISAEVDVDSCDAVTNCFCDFSEEKEVATRGFWSDDDDDNVVVKRGSWRDDDVVVIGGSFRNDDIGFRCDDDVVAVKRGFCCSFCCDGDDVVKGWCDDDIWGFWGFFNSSSITSESLLLNSLIFVIHLLILSWNWNIVPSW